MAVFANIVADQGSTFAATITVTGSNGVDAADLTGFSAAGQARRTFKSATAYPFTVTVSNPTLGLLTLALTAVQTEAMVGRYFYDVEVTAASGEITRVIEGQLTVSPGITR